MTDPDKERLTKIVDGMKNRHGQPLRAFVGCDPKQPGMVYLIQPVAEVFVTRNELDNSTDMELGNLIIERMKEIEWF